MNSLGIDPGAYNHRYEGGDGDGGGFRDGSGDCNNDHFNGARFDGVIEEHGWGDGSGGGDGLGRLSLDGDGDGFAGGSGYGDGYGNGDGEGDGAGSGAGDGIGR